jgi:hypothetical protein
MVIASIDDRRSHKSHSKTQWLLNEIFGGSERQNLRAAAVGYHSVPHRTLK